MPNKKKAAKNTSSGGARRIGVVKSAARPGTPKATPQDADILMKLYDLRREPLLRKARNFLVFEFSPQTYEDFKTVIADFGGEKNNLFRQASSYWDMAAAMVLYGALHEGLFFRTSGEAYLVYAKFKPFLAQLREEFQATDFLASLEELATHSREARERVERLEKMLAMRAQALTAKAS